MAIRVYVSGVLSGYHELDIHRIILSTRLQHNCVVESFDTHHAFGIFLDTNEGIHGVRHFRHIFSGRFTSIS